MILNFNAMKILKLLVIAALLMPVSINAQTKRKAATTQTAQSEASKYPRYSDTEAAVLWKKWKNNETFSQDNYARVVDLCDASFEYLAVEIQHIISTATSPSRLKEEALKLDMGITSNMSNFARAFAVRMQNLAAQGQLTPENTHLVAEMLVKKKKYMELNHKLYHPN